MSKVKSVEVNVFHEFPTKDGGTTLDSLADVASDKPSVITLFVRLYEGLDFDGEWEGEDIIEIPHTPENIKKVREAAALMVSIFEDLLGQDQVSFEEI